MCMDLKDKYISMIAIAISIIAIAIAILSCESIQIDWVGFVISSLPVLVTLLTGWNIYTCLDIKQVSLEDNIKRFSRPHVESLLSDILTMRVSQRTEKFSQYYELLLTLLLRLD